MAEGLARARFEERVVVRSAGSSPGTVNPHAVAVMAEIGIDISSQYSKHVDTIDVTTVDTIVTLCAEEVCPVVSASVRRLAWPLPDPAGCPGSEIDQRALFRTVRDEIARRLTELEYV